MATMGTWGDEPFSDNQFKRMVVGYTFLIPLIIQAFLMNPIYEKSKQVKLIRMGLIPLTIYLTVTRTYIRLFYPLNEFFHWNFAFISFSTFHAVCLSLQFGLYRGSVFASKSDLIKAGNYRGDPDDKKDQQERLVPQNPTPSFLEKVKFTIWLLFSPRGLETSWAPALDVVPRGAKMSVGQFFIHTLCKTVVCHITGTVLWIIAANNAQHPYGAYGVIADYIPPLQFLKKFTQFDYLTSFYFAAVSWASIETLGCLLNLLEIAVYQFGPYVLPKDLAPGKFDSTLYPPLFNDLLERESMITFWSKGWHAIFRRNIVFCGWNPAESMFASFGKDTAKTAGMMGGMIFSGIFHEYLIAAVSTLDPRVPALKMFVLCGAAMVAEVHFKRATGRFVKGIPGKIWCLFIFSIYGKLMVDSWMERGLGRYGMGPVREWKWPRYVVPLSGFLPERWLYYLAS